MGRMKPTRATIVALCALVGLVAIPADLASAQPNLLIDSNFHTLPEATTTCGPAPPAQARWQPYSQTPGSAPTLVTSPKHGTTFHSLHVACPSLASCAAYGAYQELSVGSIRGLKMNAEGANVYEIERGRVKRLFVCLDRAHALADLGLTE